jgi:prepilin-type N-terminal cleavage/methylation domain-containing protein
MSRISAHNLSSRRGFTLVELLVATSISAIVLGGVIAAYLFMARNLERLVHLQQQEVQSRRTLKNFTQDLSAARVLTTISTTSLSMTKPTSGGTTTISYNYVPYTSDPTRGDFNRVENSITQVQLSNVTRIALAYYSEAGSTVTVANPQSVKSVELSFTTTVGNTINNNARDGTQVSYAMASPRVVLRNKQTLQ